MPGGALDHLEWRTTSVLDRPARYGVAGQGPPLVFLHGWWLGYKSYKRALKRLVSQGHRVYAPALPGFAGTAELEPLDCTMPGYATWVLAFMDTVEIDEPVTLMGHSFGGGVAIRTAYQATERVSRLILVNSIGGSAWGRRGTVRALKERPLWDWGLHLRRDILPLRQATRVLPVLLEDLGPNVARHPRTVWRVAGLARRVSLIDELEALKQRRLPIVILWGASDKVIPERAFRDLCSAAGVGSADASCVTVEGNHTWLLADPDGFAEVMTNVVDVAKQVDELEQDEVS